MTGMDVESLYAEIILDHYRSPITPDCGSPTTSPCTT